MFKARISL